MFSAHRAGVTPLNEASPAPGWPSDWLGKSQHVYASRSVRPSMAHASGSRDGCAGDEARATTSTYVPVHMNRASGGRCAKVKICLGASGCAREPADRSVRRIRATPVSEVEGRGGVAEPKGVSKVGAAESRVYVRGVEDIAAARRVVDRHGERGRRTPAGPVHDGRAAVRLVDDDLVGPEGTQMVGGLARGRPAGDRAHLDLVSEERRHVREAGADRRDAVFGPTVRVRRDVEGRRQSPPPGAREEEGGRSPDQALRPPESRAMQVVRTFEQ